MSNEAIEALLSDPRRQEVFWRHVQRFGPHECWIWSGQRTGSGYGLYETTKNGRNLRASAHRASFAIHNKGVAPLVCVLHSCDERLCVNPSHLFLGDRGLNYVNMRAKGKAKIYGMPLPELGALRRSRDRDLAKQELGGRFLGTKEAHGA